MKKQIAILLLICPLLLFSQEDTTLNSTVFILGGGLHQAFVLVHSEDIRPVEHSYPRGIHVDFAWQQRSREAFDKCRCFPRMGASLQLWDFDNPDVLGYGANAYFFIEPEYGAGRFFSFLFRGGFGASLLTTPYHATENPDNQSYSTHLAFSLILSFKASFRLSDNTRLDIAPYYNHNSNGGVKQPNAGINYPSISLGISHYMRVADFHQYVKKGWDRENRVRRLDITPFLAWKQMTKGVHVFSPGLEIKGVRQVAGISALTIGMEYLEDNFARYNFDHSSTDGNWRKLGAAFGHEFLMGKLIFSQQLGVYLYNPDWEGDALYQRWGLVYFWNDHFATGINLKAHRHVANFVDFRLTYSLN